MPTPCSAYFEVRRIVRIIATFLPFALASAACSAADPALHAGIQPPQASPPVAASQPVLAQLAEDYFETRLRLFSLAATEEVGDPRFEGELEIEIAPEHRVRQEAAFRAVLANLERIPRERLSPADRLTWDVLRYDASARLEALLHPRHLLPINQMDSVPLRLAQWSGGQSVQPFKTVANYDNYLKRIERLPLWVDTAIANMREGMRRGIVSPRAIVERALPPLEALAVAKPEDSPFHAPIGRFPESISTADRARLAAAYRDALAKRILPAQRKLAAFLRDEYLPKARASAGLGALPGGAGWYRFQVREATTTTLAPELIHARGLAEVARIRAEMDKIRIAVGFDGSLADFLKGLEARAELTPFRTEDEVVTKFAALDRSIAPRLAAMFGRRPRAALEIRPVDPLVRDTAPSHYILPAVDGSRPGVFYAAVVDPRKYTAHGMVSLLLHEGQPGHHFQLALQQEADLPRFRRFLWYDAYGEGWALYAESLGRELGLYDDPWTRLGQLQAELVRATRLVVDTGLHARDWSRQDAIRYLMEMEAATEPAARRAVERYMAWPGQALAYKIGELKIRELRERAVKNLGAGFDLAAFHDEVLSSGALPLSMLEARIDTWIDARRSAAPALAAHRPGADVPAAKAP